MIKLEHVVLASPEQMKFIIEGMRNPMNSWEKSDSELETAGYDVVGFGSWRGGPWFNAALIKRRYRS